MADSNTKYVVDFAVKVKNLKLALREIEVAEKKARDASSKERKEELKQLKVKKDSVKEELRSHDHIFNVRQRYHREEDRQSKKRMAEAKQSLKELRHIEGIKKRYEEEENKRKKSQFAKRALIAGAIGYGIGRVAGATLDFIRGGIESTYGKFQQYALTRGQSIGLGTPEQIKAGLAEGEKTGLRLGFTPTEAAGMVPMTARQTGVTGPRELMGLMRATGMEAGEAAGLMGLIRRGGTQFEGGMPGVGIRGGEQSAGGRELAKLLEIGVSSGLERARVPEFLEGIQDLTQQTMQNAVGAVKPSDMAKILGAMGQTGLAGFQGARGAAVLSQVNKAFLQPGGGEAGMALVRRAFGFGTPGGTTDYYTAEKMREQALRGGPEAFNRLIGQVGKEHGRGREGALALRALTGLSIEQSEGLLGMGKGGKLSKDEQEKMNKALEELKPIEARALEASQGMKEELVTIAGLEKKAIAQGEKFADNIHAIDNTLVDIRDFLLDYAKPALDIVTRGAVTQKRVERIQEELRQPFDEALTGTARVKEVERLKKLADEERRIQLERSKTSALDAFLLGPLGVASTRSEAMRAKERMQDLDTYKSELERRKATAGTTESDVGNKPVVNVQNNTFIDGRRQSRSAVPSSGYRNQGQ